jgi:phosphoribosylformylglycinamidine synthase
MVFMFTVWANQLRHQRIYLLAFIQLIKNFISRLKNLKEPILEIKNQFKELKALVLKGDGINCEVETAQACIQAGFVTRSVHINDLLKSPHLFSDLSLLVLPGGFSFGDELGSGKILSLKLKYGLGKYIDSHIHSGGAVLGICNGFQVMVRLGLFGPGVALVHNVHGKFLDRWVSLKVVGESVFTVKGERLDLPIRHGEGRLVVLKESKVEPLLQYEEEVNGSYQQIAGLSAYEGRVVGLMPHPETFWNLQMHPNAQGLFKGEGAVLGTSFFDRVHKALLN